MGDQHKKTVLLIGAGGTVGMATRDAIREYTGADIIAYERELKGTPDEIGQKAAERARRAELYPRLVAANGELLDGEQAKWLLAGRKKLPEKQRGDVSEVSDYEAAIRSRVDAIIITAGVPRKIGMERNDLLSANKKIFERYAKDFSRITTQEIRADISAGHNEEHERFHLPVVINAGNPVDTMTEVLGKTIHAELTQAAKDALAEGNGELARRLGEEARSLTGKIIGQGGILDGARAATAIHETMGIHLGDILSVPVLGTHNPNMQIDFDSAIVRGPEGQHISLTEHPTHDLNANFPGKEHNFAAEITERTSKGGTRVLGDYKARLDVDQSAVLATGAAIMQMVDAVINDRNISVPAAIYHAPEQATTYERVNETRDPETLRLNPVGRDDGFVMGGIATLGSHGASYEPDPSMDVKLVNAEAVARKDYRDAAAL